MLNFKDIKPKLASESYIETHVMLLKTIDITKTISGVINSMLHNDLKQFRSSVVDGSNHESRLQRTCAHLDLLQIYELTRLTLIELLILRVKEFSYA